MDNSFRRSSVVIFLIFLTSLIFSRFSLAAQIRLAWDPNTDSDLAGYKVYYGTASGAYGTPINVRNVTAYSLTGLASGQTYFIAVTACDTSNNESGYSNEVSGIATERTQPDADFDGDGKADIAVYDMVNGSWSIRYSLDGSYGFDDIGTGGGSRWRPVAGDYDGDGKTDVAVYDAQDGWWLFHYTAGGYFYDHIGVGGIGYSPVPGDYDGDGVTDIAVYNVTNGYWYIKYSSGGYGFDSLGGTGLIPVPADYDGDGKTDVAVYDVANGWWYLHYSKDGSYVFDAISVGGGSQWKPVPGDYDGDGKTDVAVYDTQDGWWLFHHSSGGYSYDHIGQGGIGYAAVPGDYDGDGVTDLAVYDETNGYWFIKYSNGGYGFDSLGGSGRIPVNLPYLFGAVF